MSKFAFLLLSAFAMFATAATAQEIAAVSQEDDCEDEANKDDEACIILPGAGGAQNLSGIGPLIGGGGILASGLFGNNTTTTTTTTTTTN